MGFPLEVVREGETNNLHARAFRKRSGFEGPGQAWPLGIEIEGRVRAGGRVVEVGAFFLVQRSFALMFFNVN